ncbi:MAG: PKD-like domain-containing protein, partial [Chryseolinea sp.]
TGQPVNSIICQGSNTSFTVNAGATTSPNYQWQVSTNSGVTYTNLTNTGIYTGVTTATLNLATTPAVNNGYLYRVIVGGACAPVVTSDGALLTVNQLPLINTQPVTATICEDGTVQFSVVASGTALTYQWREQGNPLSNNATYSGTGTATLTITNVASALNGMLYDVVVSGTCISPVISAQATLNVNEKPEITAQPVNSAICETSNTSFIVNAGVTTAATYQWQVSTNSGVSYANLTNAGIYTGVTSATLNLTATPAVANGYLYRVLIGGTCIPGVTSNGALLTVNQIPIINTQPVTATVCEDGTLQFNVVTTGTALTYQWRQEGTPLTNNATYSGVGTTTLTIANVTSGLNGLHYDVVVGGTCAPPVTSVQATLNVNEKPEITSHPGNSTICQGNNTSFTVNAGATTGATYQWQVSTNSGSTFTNLTNAGIYSGVTTASLNLTTTPPANNGYVYRVIVGGTCSPAVISDGALLTVKQNAIVALQPASAAICEDGTVQFSIAASGTGLTYQWRENGVPLSNGPIFSGVATPVLTLANVPSTFNGKQYDVILLGACLPAASAVATLTVNEKPEITAQPINASICQGSNTSFNVNAGVTTTPTYQWQVSSDGGVIFTNLVNNAVYSGVATSSLSLTNPSLLLDGLLYRVSVGGSCAPSVVSNAAILRVNDNPVIVTQPSPQVICENSLASFTALVTGTGLTYQWQENGVNLANSAVFSGVNTPTLTITNASLLFNGRNYAVLITAICGTLTSSNALLTVNRIPNAFATDAAICSGQTTSVAITNPNAVSSTTFTWTVQSSTNVSGASAGLGSVISQTLTSTDGVNPGTVTYLIQPSAAGCNGTPYAVNVSVKPIADAAASPQNICSGGSTSVAITNPNGVAGTSYSWTVFSSSNVTGAAAGSGGTISQVLTAADGINSGTVTYRVTPSAGSCPGAPIDVIVTVSPSPVITSASTSLIQEICSATALNFLPTSSITGTTFNWTSSVIGTVSGVSPGGNGAITDTPVNSTSSNAVIIYTITPAISGCNGSAVNYVVTVRPVTSASASNQIICSGSSSNVVITNPNGVSGTTYTWTTSATNANGAAAGSGNVISQVLTSVDGLNNGIVTYTITPTANGCPGPTFPVTVTVKPVPVMTNSPTSLSQQICSTEILSFVPAASIGGATFSWTATISGPINPATITSPGSGNITNAPQNTGNVNGTVTYHIIPSFNSCDGNAMDFVVTVKPLPSASASAMIICSGQTAIVNLLPAPQNIPGTTFDWTAAPSANVSGAANGNGSTISQTLSTTNASIGTVMYTITPMANGCVGPTSTVTVTINPTASVNAGADYAVCEPVTIPISGTIGGSATSGNWTLVSGAGTLSASTVSGTTVTANYTVNASDIGSPVTFLLSSNDPDGGGPCSVFADQLIVNVNRQARVTLPANYVVCEPGVINLAGVLSGSATSGLWSVDTGNGVLSASSVTASNVTASYTVPASDVNTSLVFRLTSNDPDASGPCVAESSTIDIFVNMSANVNAGSDFAVCENQPINLAATVSGSTASVLWSGGSGGAQFSPVNNANSTYTITPADITAGGVTLTITTNDPDAAGPCTAASDPIFVRINKLPAVYLVGLEPIYAENGGIDNLDGFPVGGVFTGPGIVAGTNLFNPANAGFGTIIIRYTYVDPATGCSNYVEKNTIVNPLTDIDFYIREDNRVTPTGNPQICANQGYLTLVGVPDVSEGFDPTLFRGISPELAGRISYDGTNWKLLTDGLNAGSYLLQFIFTNEFAATDTLTKDLVVFSAPKAVIDLGNSCIDDVATFLESSNIPNNLSGGSIVTWNWFFDEGSNGSSGSTMEPQYQYSAPGPKNISLEVVTDQQCRSKIFKAIIIGKPPVPDFSWTSYCKGDATKFKDRSMSTYGNVNSYTWDFADGGTSIAKDPSHKFLNFGSYPVKLSIGTDAGCFADTTKQVYIQDLQTPSPGDPYSINFEDGPETWVAITAEGDFNNSWIFGLPNGPYINSAASGSNAWWTGRNAKSYYDNEKSYVIGPCLDLTNLKRPMISLNYRVDTQAGFDGAVMQYSVNGGATWETIGDAEGGGINWYNSRNLSGQPGGQSNFAWSAGSAQDTVGKWTNARYNLDQIPFAVRDTVIFRMAFGSNGDTGWDGFAFDDVFVGEKTRNVMVETFANVNVTASNNATIDLKKKYADQFLKKDSSDFFFVEYHVLNAVGSSIPDPDPVSAGNKQDPIARALLYNVAQPPSTIMDGMQDGNLFNGYTGNITAIELDRRALIDPTFKIDIDTVNTSTSNTKVRLALTYTYIDSTAPLQNRVTMQAAIVEKGVGNNGPVVRKLLLGSEGKTVDRTWNRGDKQIADVDYDIEVPIANSDSVFIVAFIQDNFPGAGQSKKILQSKIIGSYRKKSLNVTSIEDNPITGELKDLSVYPNPASNHVNISVPIMLMRNYQWTLIDQRGITVLDGDLAQDFTNGPQEIDISRLANGIYFMSIQTGEKSIIYKKIAVMNKN